MGDEEEDDNDDDGDLKKIKKLKLRHTKDIKKNTALKK